MASTHNILSLGKKVKERITSGRCRGRISSCCEVFIHRTSQCLPYLPEFDYEDVRIMMEDSSSLPTTSAVPVEPMLYFYGNISRETAEWILWDRGCQDGMYLLRESNSDYVLSLCFLKSVLHYRIKRFPNGEVELCGVPRQRFPGPVELMEGVEGLACKPTIPCNKSLDSVLPLTHWGVTEEEIRKAMLQKAREWGIDEDKLDSSLTQTYNDIKLLITKTLHEIQPWYHGQLSRVEAENRVEENGHKDGKFLVRERDDSSYALCLSHLGKIKHYKIDVLPSGEFAIQDGQRFPSIMALISHYSLLSDGLWCTLTEPCPQPQRCVCDVGETQLRSSRNSTEGLQVVDTKLESRSKTLNSPSHVVSDRSKLGSGRQSPSSSTPSKSSKFMTQRGSLLTKLVASVAPQVFQTSPRVPSHPPETSTVQQGNVDNFSDYNDSSQVTTNAAPSSGHSPVRKPNRDELSSQESKKSKFQKASSFDLIPAFFSWLFTSELGEGRNKKKSFESSPKRPVCEVPPVNNLSHCNGSVGEPLTRSNIDELNKSQRSTPVPAPRLSLARKQNQEIGPVYANTGSSCTLTFPGRSISLGDTVEEPYQFKEEGGSEGNLNSRPLLPPFIRSASSPTVGSQPQKTKHQLPPKSSQASPLNILSFVGSESLPATPCTPKAVQAETQPFLPNGKLSLFSSCGRPVPLPRLKLQNQEDCNTLVSEEHPVVAVSPDDNTSPTLTEDSEPEKEPCKMESDEVGDSVYIEIDPQHILHHCHHSTSDPESCICKTDFHTSSAEVTSKPLLVLINGGGDVRVEETAVSNFLVESDQVSTSFQMENTETSTTQQPDDSSTALPNYECSGTDDGSIYARLAGSDNLIATMDMGVGSEPTSPAKMSKPNDDVAPDSSGSNLPLHRTLSKEESEIAYKTLRRIRRGPVSLDPNSLILKEKIGSGNFGDVQRGVFASGLMEVQFAVKMLKSNAVPHQKNEILKEAQTMAALDHPHIVRLIGVCEGDPFMLVMELAPLGPLSKHLRQHRDMSVQDILVLMLQVAMAMEYLESKQFVHRDLAARNVLLVNESFAKISDFGMSRALGLGKEYYRAEVAGKWPLKWYAPECIYYFKFSTKSDVWSFGITLWESLSYGDKPYKGMVGREILQMFERNERLPQPEKCPPNIYKIMKSCWQYKPEERPTFLELFEMLREIVGDLCPTVSPTSRGSSTRTFISS